MCKIRPIVNCTLGLKSNCGFLTAPNSFVFARAPPRTQLGSVQRFPDFQRLSFDAPLSRIPGNDTVRACAYMFRRHWRHHRLLLQHNSPQIQITADHRYSNTWHDWLNLEVAPSLLIEMWVENFILKSSKNFMKFLKFFKAMFHETFIKKQMVYFAC